jgi:hypothetical protein
LSGNAAGPGYFLPLNADTLGIAGCPVRRTPADTGDDPMRKLTMVFAATALVALTGAANACPGATTADNSTPTTTAQAPISKPVQN